jgi:hypothetical protein
MEDITYTEVNGYLIPDLILPDEPEYEIGRFGLMRRSYLKKHQKALYTKLLTSGKLHKHLYETDQAANDRFWTITNQMAKAEGVTEQLKAEQQFKWIGLMNNIRNRAEEIILAELIYA